jgi:hypothetical protein
MRMMVIPRLTQRLDQLRIAICISPQCEPIRSAILAIETALTSVSARMKERLKSSASPDLSDRPASAINRARKINRTCR